MVAYLYLCYQFHFGVFHFPLQVVNLVALCHDLNDELILKHVILQCVLSLPGPGAIVPPPFNIRYIQGQPDFTFTEDLPCCLGLPLLSLAWSWCRSLL